MTTLLTLIALFVCGAVVGAALREWFDKDFTAYLLDQVEAWRKEAEGE